MAIYHTVWDVKVVSPIPHNIYIYVHMNIEYELILIFKFATRNISGGAKLLPALTTSALYSLCSTKFLSGQDYEESFIYTILYSGIFASACAIGGQVGGLFLMLNELRYYHKHKLSIETQISNTYEETLRFFLEKRDYISEIAYRMKLWSFDNITMVGLSFLTMSQFFTNSEVHPSVHRLALEMYEFIKKNDTPPTPTPLNLKKDIRGGIYQVIPLFTETMQNRFVTASLSCIQNRGNVSKHDKHHICVEDFCDILTTLIQHTFKTIGFIEREDGNDSDSNDDHKRAIVHKDKKLGIHLVSSYVSLYDCLHYNLHRHHPRGISLELFENFLMKIVSIQAQVKSRRRNMNDTDVTSATLLEESKMSLYDRCGLQHFIKNKVQNAQTTDISNHEHINTIVDDIRQEFYKWRRHVETSAQEENLLDLTQIISEGKYHAMLGSTQCKYPFFDNLYSSGRIPSTSFISEDIECYRILKKKMNSFPRWVDKEVDRRHSLDTSKRSSTESWQMFKSNGDAYFNRCIDFNAFLSAGLTRYGLCALQIMNRDNEAASKLDREWVSYFSSKKFLDKVSQANNKLHYYSQEFPDITSVVKNHNQKEMNNPKGGTPLE